MGMLSKQSAGARPDDLSSILRPHSGKRKLTGTHCPGTSIVHMYTHIHYSNKKYTRVYTYTFKTKHGAGEIALQLRALAALPGVLSSNPSSHNHV